jgi:exodeoxyribonuclease V alpha subunit
MSFVVGKVRKIIYMNEANGFRVGLFRVKDSNINHIIDKTITFTGSFCELNNDLEYIFRGNIIQHQKYGKRFVVESYEFNTPKGIESIMMYLSSGLFNGIGEKMARKIVDNFGEDSLDIIKNDYELLTTIKGMSLSKAKEIHERILSLEFEEDHIISLTSLGFSMKEAIFLLNKYSIELDDIINSNIYILKDDINFTKLDNIYLKSNSENTSIRIKEVIKYIIRNICYENGNTYVVKEEIYINLNKFFSSIIDEETFNNNLNSLIKNKEIYNINDGLQLDEFYDTEYYIYKNVYRLKNRKIVIKENLDNLLSIYEKNNNILFDSKQKKAIKDAIINNLFIISGGPGTGKTSIIKAIIYLLNELGLGKDNGIKLLAPTGKSAKRLSETTLMSASTIHKFLKWNKETNEFSVNEHNKANETIIIIDEFSMVDIFLFKALLKALKRNIKLILVGDAYQLPSIMPGDILNDLLKSKSIKSVYLEKIYRTKEGAYIVKLAKNIKNKKEILKFKKEDGFRFLETNQYLIKGYLESICNKFKEKNLDLSDFEVLVPMYKTENGIDNLNKLMQDIFNPEDEDKPQIKYNSIIYREGDKVIQLVNDIDNNVFNGDIGYISNVFSGVDECIEIKFGNSKVLYSRKDYDKFSHAYAISVHKSQGSEYENVVIVLSNEFKRMLYNKLLYTAVTRSKNNLIIIGNIESFNYAIKNEYAKNRKTNLVYFLNN